MIDRAPSSGSHGPPNRHPEPNARQRATVRDAALGVMRHFGLTTIFGNPGSTEIPFLTGLPSDIEFVLGLHEGSVVGIATGYALARGKPALVNLHTAAGLGNAINAIANARDCRAPLVILVGQQDRRQLAYEPFLTGRSLERLGGDYLVWSSLPVRAQDVPGSIARAYHEAQVGRGPALVVVPMGDWEQPADELAAGWPQRTVSAGAVASTDVGDLADLIRSSGSPALVVGHGTDSRAGWDAVVALAERLGCPVWQESFTRRVGFPQDHALFAGHLPWRRRLMREALAAHDLVVAVGTSAFRLYLLDDDGPMVAPGTRVAVLTDDPGEAHRSPCELAVVAPVAAACEVLAADLPARERGRSSPLMIRPAAPPPPPAGEPLAAVHVVAALGQRLPVDAVLVEETPSSQPELYQHIVVRSPGGFVACGNGALGFGLAGSIGLRMGDRTRPVVAVVGDGSSLYAIQALWSAAHYGVGVLLIVMANGRYSVMDRLARARQASAAWPAFEGVDVAGLARCLGCPAAVITTHRQLIETLDDVLPSLVVRQTPLVVQVTIDD